MRRGAALLAAVVALLAHGTPGAHGAAPVAQRAELESGSAILRYAGGDAGRRALAARLDRAGLRAAFLPRLGMAGVHGPVAALRAAARGPEVVAAHPDRRLSYELYEGTPLVFGGPAGQAELAAAGYDGRGVTIAVVDTGVAGEHPDLAGQIDKNYKVVGDAGVVVECPAPCDTDDNGHGSHVAGIATGDGTASEGFYTGIAPGARLVGYSVGAGPSILYAVQAYEHILANPTLGIRAVNSSFGVSGGGRFDSTDPINQATKRLHDAGITVVFSNGNSGANTDAQAPAPPGASDCSKDGPDGACKTNPYSVAPWVISAAAGRKDRPGRPGDQVLSNFSSRGDPDPTQEALSGETIDYAPTLTAPGTNVRSVKAPFGSANTGLTVANDPSAAIPPAGHEDDEAFYLPLSGTSMAAPAVTGAVAVIQSAAQARLGRPLTPTEVERVLTRTAQRMPAIDAQYDYPCPDLVPCGEANPALGQTGEPYERWHVGAGYLDLAAAVKAVEELAEAAEEEPEPDAAPTPSPTVAPSSPSPPTAGAPSPPPPVTPPTTVDPVCAAARPTVRLRSLRVETARRGGRLRLRGTATGGGCAPLRAVRRVRVSVGRRSGTRCRFLDSRGRASRPRRCSARSYVDAAGTATWRHAVRVARGRHLVRVRAEDVAGDRSAPSAPARFTVR